MSRALRTLVLVATLGSALAHTASAARGQGCEPEDVSEPRALEAAVKACDAVAATTTSATVRHAALCRSAAYCFRIAQAAEGDRASDWAERGMKLADRARVQQPDRVEGHYRYALCLGIYLREHSLSAITRLDELINAAKRAVTLDERYDGAGPHVLLALLYAQAPRLVGPGDHDLAKKHMTRFLELAGDDEGNKLAAVKVWSELGEEGKARRLLKTVDPRRARDNATRLEVQAELDRLKKELED